jgi:hypothetical protein
MKGGGSQNQAPLKTRRLHEKQGIACDDDF